MYIQLDIFDILYWRIGFDSIWSPGAVEGWLFGGYLNICNEDSKFQGSRSSRFYLFTGSFQA